MEFYHLLNRGVDKRNIFNEEVDYIRFIHNLFERNNLQTRDPNWGYHFKKRDTDNTQKISEVHTATTRKREMLVRIHFFCLMPNHYHLLVSPIVDNGVSLFMKKINMGYAKYFNEKYKRVGALFQGKYKSVHVENDAHFLHIPYYIHFNPLDLAMPKWRNRKLENINNALHYLAEYRWSSHLDYLGIHNFPSVTQRDFFTDFFGGKEKYRELLLSQLKNFSDESVQGVTLE